MLKRFNRVNEAKAGGYNVPYSKTFPSVDSVVPLRDLFPTTISQSHGIKEGGLNSFK